MSTRTSLLPPSGLAAACHPHPAWLRQGDRLAGNSQNVPFSLELTPDTPVVAGQPTVVPAGLGVHTGREAIYTAEAGARSGVRQIRAVAEPPKGGNSLHGVTIHPPLRSTPLVRALNAAHGGRVCSTWGNFHYKTFDGDVFRFPGLCNYVFSAHCGAAYEDFNLQLRRGPGPNATAPSRVTMKLDGMVVELTKGSVLVNGRPIQLPFSHSGVLIEQSSSYVKVAAKLGLVFMWNQDDSLLLELDAKYANQTCGLCGDFNGVPIFNEFFSHNVKLTSTEFGNLQKMDGPTEQCQDPAPEPPTNCLTGFCPGTCSVLGGAHFSTFDERQYTVHGDCSYVLAKPCDSSTFTVLAELRRCGLTDSETCLKSLTLILGGGHMVFVVKASGEVFVNQIYTQLPLSAANVTLFRPSTFFIIAQTQLGLQLDIQLVPVMQVFVRLAPQLRGQTCGLCGNFNQNQADDFRTISGVVEGTAAAFANTWKTQAACPNVKNGFEDPCSLSVENEKYAQHWCSRLTDPHGPFTRCHAAVNPSAYYSNCMFDTCSCEKSEDCMCAALSSYVRACAARGVLLGGWRDGVCTKPMTTCPKSLTYLYNISTCQPTCRARSDTDVTCSVSFVPVDGCTCPDGTFLDDMGKCVPATSCPCYHGGSVVPDGESTHEQGVICTCTQGTLTCIGGHAPAPVCTPPMVYFDCRNTTPGAAGAGCQKSCHTLDMDCYSSQCVPGCVCPHGLVANGDGGCIPVSDCPCVHNEASYQPGQIIRVGCNTCTCKSRMWQCTDQPCPATCAVYGDGHYLTFDGQRYSFSGDCEYTLLQDHCRGNGSAQDGFRVITENVPCGTTGTTCSKAIKIFLGSYELTLSDGNVEVIEKEQGQLPPFSIRQMGIYLAVDTDVSLVLLWDRGTTIFLRLSPEFKGRVCGLCGNFDDNALNDFTTRSQSVVGDALEFGNSWKFSPSCPDAQAPKDPCTANPYRKSWAQKQCSIINSATFSACHAHVESARYYEACVSDACACDSGGDCECFCTAVAAYAQACHEAGVCVSWRTPDICPLFCDYYNPQGQCEWHYQPCGAPFLRTCRNPRGQYLHDVRGLEGCYPKCPSEAPIFDEDQMRCVASCPTPTPPTPCRVQGKSYRPGSVVPLEKNCHYCVCTESGVHCTYDSEACVCTYDGRRFRPGKVIYHTTDGTGGCISARCGANGTIERRVEACSPTPRTPQTTFTFSTTLFVMSSTLPPSTHPSPSESTAHTPNTAPATTPGTSPGPTPPTAPSPPSSRPHCGEDCQWSPWLDVSRPGWGIDSGDFDTLENLRAYGYRVCRAPRAVECRAEGAPEVPLEVLGQHVECSPTVGLTCYNRDQASGRCDNYQIRILCCSPRACPTSSTETTPPATFSTTETGPTPGTRRVTSVPTGSTGSSAPVTTPGPTTASTTSKTPGPGTSTPAPGTSTTGKTTLSTPSPAPVSTTVTTTTSVSTTTPGPSKGTSSEPTQVTCLQESCTWTKWIDGSYPGAERNSGDFDSFQNLRSKGYKFCAKPKNVECRAEVFPNTPLQALGQNLICDKNVGLICWNKDQLPPICYNYQIRILCCEVVDVCGTNITPPTTPGPTQTTTGETSTARATATFSSSTQHSTASSAHVPPRTRVTTRTNERTSLGTTSCQPQCTWTKWFDADFPSPGPHGGDFETYSNIVRRGEKICHRPEYISALECRAENHPDVSIQTLGQVVQCSPEVGLVCRNRDQKGKFRMCLNYEVRVLCCEPQEGCTVTHVTVPSTSSVSVTSQTRTTSHEATSTPRTSTTTIETASTTSSPTTSTTTVETTGPTTASTTSTTSAPTTSTTTVETTSPTTAPTTSTTTVETASTTSAPTTSTTTVETTSPTTAPTTSTTSAPTTSTTTVETTGPTTAPTRSTTTVETTSPTTAPRTSTTTVETTSPTTAPRTSTTFVPILETTHSQPGTTSCQPQCTWTKWFDADFPFPGPHGGDFETYSNIIRRGEKICHRPEYISALECRAENHPDVSIQTLGQVVQCSPEVGLVCRNRDQKGKFRMCLNYEVRVLCCEPQEGCTVTQVTVPSTSSVSVTSQTRTTSHEATSSATTVQTTRPTAVPITSTTSVETTSPTTAPTTSTTTVETASTTSAPTTSTTTGETTGPTTAPRTSTTTVETASTTSAPTTSTATVETTSPTTAPTTSATTVETTSPTPVPTISTTTVETTSPTTAPRTSTTTVETASTTSAPTTSTTTHNLSSYNQHHHCGDNRPNHSSYNQHNLSSYNQHHHCGDNWPNHSSYKNQHNFSSYNQHHHCGDNQPNHSFYNQHNLSSYNQHHHCGDNQPNHSSYNHSYNQHNLSSYNQHHHCGDNWPNHSSYKNNIIRRGEKICHRPEYISALECRAENHPDVSIQTLGQVVQCSPEVGLVCRNRDQKGKFRMCLNYETTAPTTSTTTQGLSTCEPRCQWTQWFDEDYPKSEKAGGDVESYDKIRRAGGAVCEQPQGIECQAENFPDVRLEELNQRVHCDVSFGLVCRNDEQVGLFKMCYNYKIRVLCCGYSHCGEPTSPTATATASSVTAPTATTSTATATTVATSTAPTATTSTATAPTATTSTATATTVATSTAPTATTSTATAPTATTSTATATTVATSTAPTATTSTATAPTATTSTATAPTATTSTATPTTVATSTAPTATTSTATAPTATTSTATAPTATTSTATATTVATSTATTATASTVTAPTATASSATATTVATSTATTATASTATAPTATTSTATATTVATSTATTATASTATTATASTATAPTATTSTAIATTVATSTAPTATASTATAPTATTPTATATTVATSTAPTATASTVTAPTATTSTATATTVATSTATTATTSTATAPTATASTATTVATSTATTAATSTTTAPAPIAPTSPTSTATATTATTSTATVTTAATSTAAIATVATSAATASTSPTASSTTTAVSPATQPRTRPGSTGVTRSPASSATPAPSLSTGLTAQVTSSRPSHTGTLPVFATSVLPTHTASRGPTPASVTMQTSTSQLLTGTAVGKTGTTSTGPLSTSHPETSMPGTLVSTGTTTCEPRCQWTEWFDEDYPKSEEAGGDVESYDKIRRAGGAVCEQPQGIECQAENFPDMRLEELNQRVHCDVSFGLVCRNDEQAGLFKMCYNYKIRVLCCGYSHCGEPTSPTATATASSVTAPTATTSAATAPTVATSTAPTATTSTATAPTATTSTATATTVATTSTATAPTATTSTATAPTATTSTATATTVATSTAPTATTSTATAPTATSSTATATTVATSMATTATASTGTAPTATASTATVTTVATSTATTATTSTGTAPMATTSTARVTTAATSTAAIATAANSAATAPTSPTASSTTTTVPPATQPTTWPGSTGVTRSPSSSATPASSLSMGLTARVTLSPSHTGTLPTSATGSLTSPPGSTEPTIPGRATSVLPTHTASRGPTPTSVTTETSTSQLLTGTAVGTTGTTSTGPLSTSHPETSMPGTPVSTATTGATTSQGTTSCQPKCQWTEWFDVDFPTSGVRGGDMETYDNIRAAGGKMCQQPQKIECRAESYPEVSVDQIGQVLSCSLEVGLVCRNEEQRGRYTMCFNYNIRVYCCDDVRHCPTTATPHLTSTTLPATSSSTATVPWPSTSATTQTQPTSTAPPATGRSTATVPSPSISAVTQTGAPTTAPPTAHIHETTFGTTLLPTPVTPNTRATTYTRSLHPTASPQVTELPTRPFKTTPGPPITTPSTGHATYSTGASTRASVSTRMPEPSTSSLGTTLRSSMATSTATVSSQKTHTSSPPLVTTSPDTGSTACQPRCAWTDWLDQSYPMPGASGGDFETYANIQAAGGAICQQPLQLQCRAEALPEEALQDLGQAVQCRLEEGLVCRNRDQSSLMCLNYQIRVFCCDHSHCPSPAGPTSTTPAPSPSTISTSTGRLSSKVTTQTHLSSPGTIKRASTPTPLTGPSSTGTTEGVSTPTHVTGPSSTGTTQSISSTTHMTGPSSTGTTKRVYATTSVTGPSSTGTTKRVYATTSVTGPSSTGTTQSISSTTHMTGPSSTGTTQSISSTTRMTGPSSTGTTKRVYATTSVTGPSSTGTRQSVYTSTRVTGPFSTGTTQRISTPTTLTGPSSMGTTQRVSTPTRVTGPLSSGTTQRVYTSTIVTGPSSTETTKRVYVTTSVTGPSSTGTRQSVYTSTRVTGPFSTGTTQRISTPTTLTGPSSTGTTQRVSTPTRVTGPSSMGTTQRVSTPTHVTGPSSTGTTQSISSTTRMTGPFSTGTTKRVYASTSVTGPSSTGTTGRVYTSTTVTGPSYSGTTQRVYTSTSVTGPSSTGTTQRVSTPTTLTGPSPTGTTQRVSTPTRVTGPSSTGTTGKVYISTTLTGPFSPGTTESISTPSPSAFPGSPPMTTKPGLPSVFPTGPLLTSPISTASWSPPTTPSWSGVASGSPGTFSISTASPSPTTACLCHAFEKFFLPGDIIYNKTDGAGCHFLAICNQRCDIDRFQGACPTPSPSGTSASVPPDTPVPGCDRTIPPRQVNESWTLEDCTVARCEGDNRIVLLGPKPMGDVVCVNGHLPVRVQSGDGPCDYSYECECSCSGWGDTHYETFDGTSYSFLDNCTHVLMREIRPRHGNLSILLYNHYCEAAASCPRALSVHYESMDIVLTTTPGADGQEESLILFGQMRVRQSFSKNGLTVTATGATEMSIEIPAIGVRVIFNGRVFQAQLSYSHFSYNTEGQCGTCTNSRRDDCRRPDGTTAPTCQDMARSWLVPNSSGEGCWAPTGLPPTTSPLSPALSTPTSTPCPPEPLCELLLSPVFAGCHGLIPPGPFFSTCVSDSCGPSRPEALCQSLEAYSALCRARGVCPDWRNATSGLCDLTCPPTKVYKPCGPVQPKSCDSRSQSPASRGLAEGCFCPDGHILFNSHTDVCVPECPCVGPDGFPKFPGERWVSNCQSCVCDEGSVSVQCVPVQCEARDQPQECGWAGFVAQTRPLADNPCCMETLCVCNTSTCPQSPPKCRPGEELACTQAENSCCPTFSCRPQLCTYNGTVYGVGATFPAVIPCHTCTCLSVDTHDPTVQCEEDACNATCPQGFQYSRVAGQCCGECVQTACLTSDGRLVQPNETWVNSLVDNCTLYHCQAENGPPMLTPTPVADPPPPPFVCPDSCQVRASMTVLRHRGCATQAAVSVPFCEGFCPGASRAQLATGRKEGPPQQGCTNPGAFPDPQSPAWESLAGGHVGQGTRATPQKSESTCRTGRIRGDQTVRAELLAEPRPTPDAWAAASCEQTGWKRQEDGSRPGWRAPGRFLEEGSDRVSKSEELLWERTGAWLGKVRVPSDRERCPGQYRAAPSAQETGTGPLSPDPRETRSRAVRAVVAGGQVLRAVCLQETRAHQEVVTMQCPNGTAFQHTYTHVDECSCGPSCVSSAQAPEDSTPTFPIYGSTAPEHAAPDHRNRRSPRTPPANTTAPAHSTPAPGETQALEGDSVVGVGLRRTPGGGRLPSEPLLPALATCLAFGT
ncbi:mucin-5B [Eubalaena glacialis]|uniref:mucin-5B n=1 Tax=Eubalaena glacialis TaxID=27606 RepID=UPI002A59A3E3|nr:mucin-5B [Eubalaena glacialis]